MSIEDTLEKGYKSLFNSITYIDDNDINTVQYSDNSIDVNPPLVEVHCMPLKRIAPNAPYYESECEFTCMTFIDDDKDRVILKYIYSSVFDYIELLTKSVLSIETGLTIDGLVMDESGDDQISDNYQFLIIKIKTYLTK